MFSQLTIALRPLRLALALLALAGTATLTAAVVVTDPEGFIPVFGGGFPPVPIDFDEDGVDDVSVRIGGFQSRADGPGANRIVGLRILGTSYFAAAHPFGAFIGAMPLDGTEWRSEELIMSSCPNAGGVVMCRGQFDGGRSYLGVEFEISGLTHYGWVEIESDPEFVRASIHRWAYETETGVPIVAGIPEPGTGALVLIGAALGLAARRRRR